MPGARWFEGAELSYADHVFRRRRDADVAIVHASEVRQITETTWAELRLLTAGVANGLRRRGIAGDACIRRPGRRIASVDRAVNSVTVAERANP